MRILLLANLALSCLGLAACRGATEPVAELAVSPAEVELQLGSFVELTVRIMPLADLEPGAVPRVRR